MYRKRIKKTSRAKFQTNNVEDRATKEGDMVIIDFEGFIDNAPLRRQSNKP